MIAEKLCDRDGVLVIDQQRRLLRRTRINDDLDLGAARRQLRAILNLLERFHHAKWWIGRSAGDVKQWRRRRVKLASSKGLLDPPRVVIFRAPADDKRPGSPAVANHARQTPAPETRPAAPVSETRPCPRPPTFDYRYYAAIPERRRAVLSVAAVNQRTNR